jgi:signal transduction histidine kinase
MSHELRTPLNAIIGYSEMLTEDAEAAGDEALVRDLSRIRHAGSQLLTLINGVLDLSKVEAGRIELFYEKCNLKTVLMEAAHTIGPHVAEQNNRLVLDLDPSLEGETDQMKLTQVILNLLSNAAKFTEDGEIRVSLKPVGGMAEIRIDDSGAGMGDDELQRVFAPFEQGRASLVSRSHGGTGLGLSIAAKFIELLGGTMTVTSERGSGTQFCLKLPLVRPDHGRAQKVTGGTLVVVPSKHNESATPLRSALRN